MIERILDSVFTLMILSYVALCAIAPFALVGSIVAIAISMWTN